MISTASSNTVNFTQVCRDCKKYWKTFKIDIDVMIKMEKVWLELANYTKIFPLFV